MQTLHLSKQSLNALSFDLFEKLFKTIAQFKSLRAFHLNNDSPCVDFLHVVPYYSRSSKLTNTTYVQIFKRILSKHPTLELLDLKSNGIGALPLERQEEIYEALSNFDLRVLNLEYNHLFYNKHSVQAFSTALPKFGLSLHTLNIQDNSFKDLDLESTQFLGKAFEKTALKVLHLTLHDFTLHQKPVIVMSKALSGTTHRKKLPDIQTTKNLQNIELFTAVCNATINQCHWLHTLNLSNSELDKNSSRLLPEYSKILYATISTHESLQVVNLDKVYVTEIDDIQALNDATSKCTSLESVEFECYPSTAMSSNTDLSLELEHNENICASHRKLFFPNPNKHGLLPQRSTNQSMNDGMDNNKLFFSYLNYHLVKQKDKNPNQKMSDLKLFF